MVNLDIDITGALYDRAEEWTKLGHKMSERGFWEASTKCHTMAKCCLEVAKLAEKLNVDLDLEG